MQPPPRTAPPGASGPPPTGGVSNAFRRTRPHKQPGSTTMMSGPTMPVPPMTDPFAFGRQAVPTGSHPPPTNSNPLPMQAAPPVGFLPAAPGQNHGTQPIEGAQGPHHVTAPLSAPTPGLNVFTPNSTVSSATLPGPPPGPRNPTGANPSVEQGRVGSGESVPYITPGAYSSLPVQNRPPYGQDFRGDPAPYTPSAPGAVPSQAQTVPPPASQWMPDYGSRPPSVQNYFQPTSDPPQPFVAPPPAPSPALAPPPAPSPRLPQPAPSPRLPPSPHLPPSTPSPHLAHPIPSHHLPHPIPLNHLPHPIASPHFPQPIPSHNFPASAPSVYLPQTAPSPHTSPQMPPQNQVHSAALGPSSPAIAAPGPGPAEQQLTQGGAAASQHHNAHFQAHNYFSQNCVAPDPWFGQPSQEHFYHQMGGESASRRPDSSNSQHNAPPSQGGPLPYMADPGTVNMFFKGGDVENEETLSGEGKAINGVSGATGHSFPNPSLSNYQLPPPQALPAAEVAQRGGQNVPAHCHVLPMGEGDAVYMNDSGFVSGTPKHAGGQFDHVENLECVPNQEVLPSGPQTIPTVPPSTSENLGVAQSLTHGGDRFEGGPNLETPDSVPRPMRSESVSSSYSNVSHGSASSSRRPQGMVTTFIQQETAKPPDNSSAEYFQQIDTSPAGEPVPQNMSSRMYHSQLSQPPTPSPPKPTGIFQASANSSFEPVRSHGVGVRPAEVDQAKMVMEKSGYRLAAPAAAHVSSPGNLEQPPDNLENIFMPSTQQPGVGPPERRPSSRAHGARLKCESPATTLWAQNEIPILGANILLAPAAPPVHAPTRQASTEVIQPPEDGPLDLQTPQQPHKPDISSENLENPPKASEGDLPQASLGYASLLVPSPAAESFQNQPVLIAPPATNYSVISSNSSAHASNQIVPNEILRNTEADGNALFIHLPSAVSAASAMSPGSSKTSNLQQHFLASPINSSGSFSGASVPNPGPLNLASESRKAVKSENPPPESTGRPPQPLLSRADSFGSQNHSIPPVNSQAHPATADQKQPTNYELLDFTMHHPQNNQNQAPNPGSHMPSAAPQQAPPPSQAARPGAQQSNTTGFYLQVTKDAQQGGRGEGEQLVTEAPPLAGASTRQPAPDSAQAPEAQPGLQGQGAAPSPSHNQALPPNNQFPQPPAPGQGPPGAGAAGGQPWAVPQGPGGLPPPPPWNSSQTPAPDPQRPPSALSGQQGYAGPPSVPGPGYGGYYASEYPDGRPPYPSQYYQDDPYRRYDARYSRYEGPNPGYREGERYREQPERPSSRTSQYSDRSSSRQGYPEDYPRATRSAYDEYYADHYKNQYEYGDQSRWERYDPAAYDPRYRGYYEQYWYNYNAEAYRNRDAYYTPQQYPVRPDDQWRYDPRYDASFDEDCRRKWSQYGDESDRRSVHSEQSAHSARSSHSQHSQHSQHSRRSSFSSRSQQSQVYRSQPDLVSAGYEPTGQTSSLMVDYSYGPYSDNVDRNQTFSNYQYPAAYSSENVWPAVDQVPPRPMTPEKYSVPHRCARFGPGGQLVQVLPNLPSAGQPALVEIHSMETMLQDTQEQQVLRSFPGPLVKEETHKVDVIKFAQNKALECLRADSLIDKDSAFLIWEFIVLLCRQNGTVVGTDIADLLLREHKSVWLPGKSPNEANLIDFNNEPLERAEEEPGSGPLSLLSDTFMTVPENVGKETERFRELLLFGRKKDALESAMKNGLWGHALLLASKMDNRTHARVMTRFANSLPINDPLQTVYQLMSGRMPAAATCCGDEKWGDWRPHLAMVLSNLTHTLDLDTRTIATMGDTLASKGLTDAAHFCYMMAQVGLGVYTKKSTKMVLIGANHSVTFFKFASNEAIQRTEAYEYAQSLGSQPCSLPNFQVFKFIYACRLAEAGLSAQAFHYCEVISRALLCLPSFYSPIFISQLIQMAAKLRFFDPQLKERPEQELFIEPDWLEHLRRLDGQIKDGVISYSADRATPQQYACSTPSSEFDQPSPSDPMGVPQDMGGPAPENPLMSSLMPNPGPPPMAGVQLMPPAPPIILEDGMPSMPQVLPPSDGVSFYPVPPAQPGMVPGPLPVLESQVPGFPPPGPSYPPPYHPEQPEMYPGPPMPPQMSPQISPTEPHPPPLEHQFPHQTSQPSSPSRAGFPTQMDFYDHMAHTGPVRRSRTTSQSSAHMAPGRRSRTTSESSTHSMGRERSNSTAKQTSPPPPPIPEQPPCREEPKKMKKDSPKKAGGGGWLNWLYRKGKNEAHLPDDKNKSIVWDEKKQRWVNLDEPEEESKPLAPPPSSFPKMGPQMGLGGLGGPPSGGPPVNIFSRKAGGMRGRYVDVLNPGGPSAKPVGLAPAPADLFAPLAPMSMPTNLFVPGAAPEEYQPMEGSIPETGGNPEQDHPVPSAAPQMFNPTLYPPGPEGAAVMDGTQSGELSRSSSMSSLSREVSQHLNQAPPQPPAQGGPPTGGVTFYNPSQFAQPSAPSGGGRPGRFGQRKYPALK